MLSRLDVKLRTPTPPTRLVDQWESKTPSNTRELEAQTTLIRNRIQRHQNSSPSSIIKSINQLAKGAELTIHSGVLLRDQVAQLQRANEAAINRRERKKKRIQKQGALTKAEGENITTQREVEGQI